ncbi:hypothetical protein JTE90_016856 [Oedothorax gibbosus]|uniref:Uncharacterized protein n=1 Tax=Oedothorax gibbosus TaxID=931172 RepID=A0AAV6VZ39_9ARAC|nr:hypothetical protein JTE90_016856 [Oedothorax gibbosus]
MKSMLCLAVVLCVLSVALASGHGGIRIGIPLPFIKLRFVDIANLFGHEGGHHGGHGGFGLQIGGGHHGHHGY